MSLYRHDEDEADRLYETRRDEDDEQRRKDRALGDLQQRLRSQLASIIGAGGRVTDPQTSRAYVATWNIGSWKLGPVCAEPTCTRYPRSGDISTGDGRFCDLHHHRHERGSPAMDAPIRAPGEKFDAQIPPIRCRRDFLDRLMREAGWANKEMAEWIRGALETQLEVGAELRARAGVDGSEAGFLDGHQQKRDRPCFGGQLPESTA